MTFELFRFASIAVKMSFDSDADYDDCAGEITVTDHTHTYQYFQAFYSAAARNTAMAEAMRIAAKLVEEM